MPESPEDFQKLKRPFGTLIPDKKVTKQKLSSLLKDAKKVIAVGDATTERLFGFGIIPDVAVFDGKERRSKRSYPANYQAQEIRCTNPAGVISKQAVDVLRGALKSREAVRVLVEGEEDLLALPLFVMAPEGSAVLYGQPLEGMVVVKITTAKQKQAKVLMDKICDNTNLLNGLDNNNKSNRKQDVTQQNQGRRSRRSKNGHSTTATTTSRHKPYRSSKEN
jgi:GTP-dependent dephospho-CoA kinase